MSRSSSSTVVVIDPGSGMFKAGFAGDDAPRSYFPSYLGLVNSTKVKDTEKQNLAWCISDKIKSKRDLVALRYPIEHGIVTDWDGAQKLVDFTFQDLRVDPTESSVLMSEPPLNSMANRELWTQLMFESLNVRGFFMNSSASLSLFAFGRSAGMVVDIGEGVTSVSPQFEIFSVPNAVQRQDFAGHDLTHVLQRLLFDKGLSFSTNSELEFVREIKEDLCFAAMDTDKGNLPPGLSVADSFTLPDGSTIKIKDERFHCAEVLFNPAAYAGQGEHLRGLHEMVHDCFMNLDTDLSNYFYCNMLLTGGTSCMMGLPERLEMEMSKLLPSRKVKRVVASPERKYSVWIGGSILGSFSTFQNAPMLKKDYEEYGPSIVHRRFA